MHRLIAIPIKCKVQGAEGVKKLRNGEKKRPHISGRYG